ncbi:hypothetical protein ACFT5B_12275 [Luteimicrobium sp. NPDC057192]|uniref:hypothetical protein n=1 Tax=Luteimicrobium sp. NPDC057192 TaxID=3346042 RepID=UPI0036274E7D
MVPVPVYPPDLDVTPAPVVKVLLVVAIGAAVVFVVLALAARRWAGRRGPGIVAGACLGLAVLGGLGAFVADRLTKPGIERAADARTREQLGLRTRAADALGAAYGVTIDPDELRYVYDGSPVRVTFPDEHEETCTLGAGDALTLTCPTPLPRDPAAPAG